MKELDCLAMVFSATPEIAEETPPLILSKRKDLPEEGIDENSSVSVKGWMNVKDW